MRELLSRLSSRAKMTGRMKIKKVLILFWRMFAKLTRRKLLKFLKPSLMTQLSATRKRSAEKCSLLRKNTFISSFQNTLEVWTIEMTMISLRARWSMHARMRMYMLFSSKMKILRKKLMRMKSLSQNQRKLMLIRWLETHWKMFFQTWKISFWIQKRFMSLKFQREAK